MGTFPWVADGHLLAVTHAAFPWYVRPEREGGREGSAASSDRDTQRTESGPTVTASIYMNYFLKTLSLSAHSHTEH